MISLLYFLVAGKAQAGARHQIIQKDSSVLTILASATTFCQAGRGRDRERDVGENRNVVEILARQNDQEVQL